MAARTALKDIQIFNPYVNGNGSFNAYSYYDHGVETQENFRDVFPVTDQCERSAQLMGDDYVRLKFNLTAYVPMAAFSFIRYDGQTFFLMNDYCPQSKGSELVNDEVKSDLYEYDVKFYSVANMLRKPICYRHVKVARGAQVSDGYYEWDEPEINVSATLETMYVIIMGSIAQYAARLDSNLLFRQMIETLPANGLALGGITYNAEKVKMTQGTELSTFSFSGDKISDVCTSVVNQFSDEKKETEWYIVEDENHSLVMHFCKCEDLERGIATASDFSWKNESSDKKKRPVITGGLSKVEYSRDTSNIPQIIVPFGAERNMTYESVKGIDVISQMQSTFGKRVRLTPNTQYTVRDFNGNEHVITTDNHGGLVNDKVNTGVENVEFFEKVYPQCHFKITEVDVRMKRQDGSNIPEYTCKGIAIDSDGHEVQPEEGFYPIQIEEGTTLSVRFESGFLNGREFEIANKTSKVNDEGTLEDHYTLKFVIVADGSIEDGTLIPSGNFIPQIGDKFALFNMKMPQAYITYARQELAQAAYEKLLEYQESVPDVKCTSSARDFAGKHVGFGARYKINSEKIGFTMQGGRRVPIDFVSRITAFSFKLTKVDDVQFTLSSAIVRGVLSDLASAITSVTNVTSGLGQRSINLSRRGWRDASEVASMLDSVTSEMMLVGNEKYQFGYTSEIEPMPSTGKFTHLHVGYGQLQHTQEPYINTHDGLWEIGESDYNVDDEGNPLDPTKPYYVYAVCGGNTSATIKLSLNASSAETDLLLGILSSEYEEERVFSATNGFTAIEGGKITTEQIQDANRQLIIDFQSFPPRIIARGGAEIIGNITFKSFKDESGNNPLVSLGRNLLRNTAFTKKGENLIGWEFYDGSAAGKTIGGCSIKTHADGNAIVEGTAVLDIKANHRVMLTQTAAQGYNQAGEVYTLSAKVKASAADTMLYFGAGYSAFADGYSSVKIGEQFTAITLQARVPEMPAGTTNYDKFFLRLAADVAAVITVKEVKLEKGTLATAWIAAPEDTAEDIVENKNYIDTVKEDLQNQIDGVVDSYFMEGVPTLENAPASEWSEDEYSRHEGDTYTNIQSYQKLGISMWEVGAIALGSENIGQPIVKWNNKPKCLRMKDCITYKSGDTLSLGTLPSGYNIIIAYLGEENNQIVVKEAQWNFANGGKLKDTYTMCAVHIRPSDESTAADANPEWADTYGFCVNPTAGHSWRFCNSEGTGWHWHEIADSDAVKALQEAAAAQDTADGKRRVFTVQPVPPYDKGDLWANAVYPVGTGETYNNVLLKCKTSKTKGQSFDIADWEDSSRAIQSADIAQADATQALTNLSNMASDGVITKQEKVSIKREWIEIKSEYAANYAQGTTYNADPTVLSTQATLKTKYEALELYLVGKSSDSSIKGVIGHSGDVHSDEMGVDTTAADVIGTLTTKFKEYYDANIALLNAIDAYINGRAGSAIVAAADALEKANNIADDGIISGGTEKGTLKKEFVEIAGEDYGNNNTSPLRTDGSYRKALAQATEYGLSSDAKVTALTSAYTTLRNAMKIVLGTNAGGYIDCSNLNNDTYVGADYDYGGETGIEPRYDITFGGRSYDKDEFIALWKNYYDAEIALLNAVSDVIDTREIGGENLYSGVDPLVVSGTKYTGIMLEDGKKYVISIGDITGNAVGLRAIEKTGSSSYNDLEIIVSRSSGGSSVTYKNKVVVVKGTGKELGFRYIASGSYQSWTLTQIMVQHGEKPTAYHAGYLAKALERDATKEVTSIDGGLLLSALIKLAQGGVVRAGMSGLADYGQKTIGGQTYQSEGVGFWAGSDYVDALNAACGIETNTLPPVFLSKTGYKSRIGCFRVIDKNTVSVENGGMRVFITTNSINELGSTGNVKRGSYDVENTTAGEYEDLEINIPLDSTGFYSIKNLSVNVGIGQTGSLRGAFADVQVKIGNTILVSESLSQTQQGSGTTDLYQELIEGTTDTAKTLTIKIYNMRIVESGYIKYSFEYAAGNESDFNCCVIAKDGLMISSKHNRQFFIKPTGNDLHMLCNLPAYSENLQVGELYVDEAGFVRQRIEDDNFESNTYKLGAAGSYHEGQPRGILDLTNFRTIKLPRYVSANLMMKSEIESTGGHFLAREGDGNATRNVVITKA